MSLSHLDTFTKYNMRFEMLLAICIRCARLSVLELIFIYFLFFIFYLFSLGDQVSPQQLAAFNVVTIYDWMFVCAIFICSCWFYWLNIFVFRFTVCWFLSSFFVFFFFFAYPGNYNKLFLYLFYYIPSPTSSHYQYCKFLLLFPAYTPLHPPLFGQQ